MHYSEISYLENGMWVDAIRPMLIEPDRGRFSNSGRIVADPDRTAFFGDYFRIAGDPDGTPEFAFQAHDSRLGDLA